MTDKDKEADSGAKDAASQERLEENLPPPTQEDSNSQEVQPICETPVTSKLHPDLVGTLITTTSTTTPHFIDKPAEKDDAEIFVTPKNADEIRYRIEKFVAEHDGDWESPAARMRTATQISLVARIGSKTLRLNPPALPTLERSEFGDTLSIGLVPKAHTDTTILTIWEGHRWVLLSLNNDEYLAFGTGRTIENILSNAELERLKMHGVATLLRHLEDFLDHQPSYAGANTFADFVNMLLPMYITTPSHAADRLVGTFKLAIDSRTKEVRTYGVNYLELWSLADPHIKRLPPPEDSQMWNTLSVSNRRGIAICYCMYLIQGDCTLYQPVFSAIKSRISAGLDWYHPLQGHATPQLDFVQATYSPGENAALDLWAQVDPSTFKLLLTNPNSRLLPFFNLPRLTLTHTIIGGVPVWNIESVEYMLGIKLRDVQREVVTSMVDSPGDNFLLLAPTGWGKTLCFLIPPLISLSSVLLISPLISLLEEQIRTFRSSIFLASI
ncbi:unnamed protein product [Bemisia tabaci]|uniref:DEAD/DEAH-box helicase domain-containing protein n=1 Tax=Bemisia tabaci TaxID=7038 RepID=A0A9P0A4H6_BEMTA|nr:unnamed protein product [Bemisia tabaci]